MNNNDNDKKQILHMPYTDSDCLSMCYRLPLGKIVLKRSKQYCSSVPLLSVVVWTLLFS